MRKINIEWTETELILYSYEEEFDVDDDFEINNENCLSLVKDWRSTDGRSFDSKYTDYDNADQEIYPIEIDSFKEVFPPAPEDVRALNREKLIELDKKLALLIEEKKELQKIVSESES